MKNREVEVLFFTRDKFHYPKNTTQNELTWQLWSEIKTHNIKGEPFHSTKGKINDKGELLVELDTSKYKWIKEDIIAVFKIKGKEGNEKGAYIKEWYSLILHSYPQLTKLAENKATVKVGGLLGIGKVERVELEEEGHSCPRCTAPITVAQLRELFPKAEEDTLKTVAYTYTKYMKELQMDTCWNKAHFFAQAAIETGFKLHIKNGENMNYKSEEDLYKKFPSRFFKGKWVKDKLGEKWVSDKDPKAEFRDKENHVFKSKELSLKASELIKSTPRDQNIANFVYGNRYGNGNEASGDGWRFRGSGLIQLTFKDNFRMVNKEIEKLWGKSILTDSGAEEVRKELELAVLTSMGYFAAKGANKKANGANSDQQIKEVCKLIGRNTKFGKSKNHEEKTIFFKNKSSKTFKTNECLWGKESDLKGIMPPWMKVAWEEYEKYKGKHKKQSPLKERICDYFNNSNYKAGTNENSWCAAFVTWCLNKSSPSYEEPKGDGDVKARAFTPKGKYKEYYWEKAKVTNDNKPAYGAIAMIRWDTTGGEHVAFVIGKTKTGRIALLGGNQSIKENGVKIGSGITKSSAKESEIKFYMYPDNFLENSKLYNLTEEDITEKLTHTDTHL